MERSSPLAALQPQSLHFGHWGGLESRLNASTTNANYAAANARGNANFDFKDLSMQRRPIDYFNLKPVRGSSPTASLAADLSQNFHIDKSPQPPTPRRSLFSSNLAAKPCRALAIPEFPEPFPSTPDDSMDISPLPHKLPNFPAQINLHSPTPEPTPVAEPSAACLPESPLEALKAPGGHERRRSSLLRNSMSRTKSAASAGLTVTPQPFLFGNGTSSFSAPLTLEECFLDSPQHMTFANPMVPIRGSTRPRSSGFGRNAGSPAFAPLRKPVPSTQKPRKQIRRSLSMFEHPAEVLRPTKEEQSPKIGLNAIMDIDETPKLQLPHSFLEDDVLPRISRETMVELLEGRYGRCYDKLLVIDCRFEYEYRGGHIEGAINFNDKEELASQLFMESPARKTMLVFHCEYSAHRAPIAARFIRNEDRANNAHRYPSLTFPEVYILDGGYSAFFQEHKSKCFPQNYVGMNDKEHATACERGLGRIKQQRSKLGRAQTFAFGQHSQLEGDSPTASNRQCATHLSMAMDLDQSVDNKREPTKRLASY